ncbi:hypothetical protein DSO57_1012812 [Entomophthora muscae]|uniref:Uncharacterized protein n=1 Tax=Entomophthora muscae TaxID=34485 RepID=A0ACC2URA9_9FUNG|nr:hypothetical protein DSO57_1012812 [Entomophthora muscae]
MADLWLNTFHGYSCNVDEQPHCSRTALVDNKDDAIQNNSMAWSSFGKPIHVEPALNRFRVLKPKPDDGADIRDLEEELLYGYEWVALMVHSETNREVYEAATLLLCAMGSKKFTSLSIGQPDVLEETKLYGYTVQDLLDIIGRVLIPGLVVRLKQLIVSFVQAQDLPQSLLEKGLSKMDYNYDEYLRIRNIHGFVEGGLLVCLAASGVTGEGLTIGVAGDIIEACIITHDSYSVLYRDNSTATNIHHYAHGTLDETLSRTFSRAALLNRRVREKEIPKELKYALLNYTSSYYLLTFSSKLYGYGSSYSQAMQASMKEKRPPLSPETVSHSHDEKKFSFDHMLSVANSYFE